MPTLVTPRRRVNVRKPARKSARKPAKKPVRRPDPGSMYTVKGVRDVPLFAIVDPTGRRVFDRFTTERVAKRWLKKSSDLRIVPEDVATVADLIKGAADSSPPSVARLFEVTAGSGFIDGCFADKADAEAFIDDRKNKLKLSGYDKATLRRRSIRFPGGRNFAVLDFGMWGRECCWQPTHLLDIPPSDTMDHSENFFNEGESPYMTRGEALATAAKSNGKSFGMLGAGKTVTVYDEVSWSVAVEVGEQIGEQLWTVKLLNGVGHARLHLALPFRAVKPTAAELAKYSGKLQA